MDARTESPENEWRRKSRKCKFCKHCKTEIVGIEYHVISRCDVREELVNPERRKLFCPCFVLEEYYFMMTEKEPKV